MPVGRGVYRDAGMYIAATCIRGMHMALRTRRNVQLSKCSLDANVVCKPCLLVML